MKPRIVHTGAELADVRGSQSVVLVPTMGALHDGHLSLLEHGRGLGEHLVASIFVNPTQFAPGEDLAAYPRTLDADLVVCEKAGVDTVFVPHVDTMYPQGTESTVTVDPGPLGAQLEGEQRPTHFRGVLTVVAKLFGLVRPDVAVFGEKDYQQLALIRSMVNELCLGIDIVGCPTVREPDGLAMSSRNVYLTTDERATATAISAALRAGAAAGKEGPDSVLAATRSVLAEAGIDPDYIALRNPDLGEATEGEARLLVAARVGQPRLIDNIALTLGLAHGEGE